ncbi:LysR family transcriptional regulator [Burkholderia sp. SRS-W-2-2016]|uniref:LysR family transcriptional regulator n=1 Tax=Burkholderia sp. SRS-W-2-2016 TaxID=1926878 RepID=UPI00094B088A|nr:LysR family transcriptional regulator [Burkholderia sp. SRS-W-2-2016]OLL28323.1 LysR family transcriptional regulator [Burkholderia sp. SRS-W-2-2016]
MELRQLRYFVRAVELGSIRRAASELGIAAATLTQELGRLEAQLTIQLFRRTRNGIIPTDAGLAFLRHAQLTLQHAVDAVEAARHTRLVGHVSVGLPPSTAAVLGVPFMLAMRERHPALRVHLVEALSGHLAAMLDARQLDLALVARGSAARRWRVSPLLDERVYLLGRADLPGFPSKDSVSLAELGDLPLVVPSGSHGLRSLLDVAFERAGVQARIAYEIDGLALLMDAVYAGLGATLQPGCVVTREPGRRLRALLIEDSDARRQTMIASQAIDELSPAALAARVVIYDVARELTAAGRWPGTTFHELNPGGEEG